ncbi:hypothetical protein ABTX77_39500 [Streptomyces sp. NPDC097704]|uniref:hypothetical protein n=1 Tax=Streptomyces sp. NPDC097704 TaxID=3157101 RepID=UPI00332A3B2F
MEDLPQPADPMVPDICDRCRRAVSPGMGVFGLVQDSSWIHPADPDQDGRRLVTACCLDHLDEVRELYRARPFVNAELWARKIDRALAQYPQGLSTEELIEETGLNLIQLERATVWRSEQVRAR